MDLSITKEVLTKSAVSKTTAVSWYVDGVLQVSAIKADSDRLKDLLALLQDGTLTTLHVYESTAKPKVEVAGDKELVSKPA